MKQAMLNDYFYTKAYRAKQPVSVIIELLTQCNLKCEHCYIPSHTNPGLSTDTVKRLLVELRALGVVNVSFTGGEIFLRKDLMEIIRFARGLYMRVFLLSNGTLLTEDIIDQLAKQYIAEFSTTIFSMDEEVHDSITGQVGSLKAVTHNLNCLSKAGIRVCVKTPVMKKNIKSFLDVQTYCEANGYVYVVSPMIMAKSNGDKSPKNLAISKEELVSSLRIFDCINRNEHLHIRDVPCAALSYSFSIDCNGDVYPCNAFYYKVGNIYSNSLKDIWYESEEMNKIRNLKNSDLKVCTTCGLQSECDRCPGTVFLETGDLYACDTYAKTLAEIRLSDNY